MENISVRIAGQRKKRNNSPIKNELMKMTTRFLLDGMLGSLARWLRIGGYDTEYKKNENDDDLLIETLNTGRILLTRDEELAKRALKRKYKAIYLRSESDEVNLTQLVDELGLTYDPSSSRCPKCNHILNEKSKEELKDNIPDGTYNMVEKFWICEKCKSIYWRGSHWSNILETLHGVSTHSI